MLTLCVVVLKILNMLILTIRAKRFFLIVNFLIMGLKNVYFAKVEGFSLMDHAEKTFIKIV